jgi:hypothetical protein
MFIQYKYYRIILTQRVTTSIKIQPNIWKKAKLSAIEHEIHLSELVEEAVEKWMKDNKRQFR